MPLTTEDSKQTNRREEFKSTDILFLKGFNQRIVKMRFSVGKLAVFALLGLAVLALAGSVTAIRDVKGWLIFQIFRSIKIYY